jgi:hypothetical protein
MRSAVITCILYRRSRDVLLSVLLNRFIPEGEVRTFQGDLYGSVGLDLKRWATEEEEWLSRAFARPCWEH